MPIHIANICVNLSSFVEILPLNRDVKQMLMDREWTDDWMDGIPANTMPPATYC